VVGDAVELLRGMETASVDFVATDPPYNPQLKITMSGGKLAQKRDCFHAKAFAENGSDPPPDNSTRIFRQ
jgi:DNA modification methylase